MGRIDARHPGRHGGRRGQVTRHPSSVPITVVRQAEDLPGFARAVRGASQLAIDTETVIGAGLDHGPGPMRVLSAATRSAAGRRAGLGGRRPRRRPGALAAALDGVTADAWNATFDARVTDRDVFGPAGYGRHRGIRWWDAQLAGRAPVRRADRLRLVPRPRLGHRAVPGRHRRGQGQRAAVLRGRSGPHRRAGRLRRGRRHRDAVGGGRAAPTVGRRRPDRNGRARDRRPPLSRPPLPLRRAARSDRLRRRPRAAAGGAAGPASRAWPS